MPTYTRTTWVNDSSPDIDETNLNNIEAGIAALFNEFDANTILIANVDNTPIKLSVAASTFLGRGAADGIAAMTVAAAKTLLAIGIADITDLPADALTELWNKTTLIDDSMIGLNEIHAEGSSNFAGPGGVTITHNLNLSNYAPHIIPTADPAGALGEVWITDVAVNSFVVRNSGSAVTSFTWVIHNRT